MKCEELLAMLNEYVDGTVDPAVCEEFEKHMAGCNPCQVVVDNIRKTIQLYKEGRAYELPLPFREKLHAALQQRWKATHPTGEQATAPANITSRFDEAAAQWDNNPARVELARAVGAAIARSVPLQSNWRALDYGAGTGLLTLNLQPRLSSMVALDSSTGMLQQLAQKLAGAGIVNVQVRQWNLEAEAFPETGFDLVVSSMTFHHLRDVPLVLRRLAAVLKPGGWLAAADLDTEDGSFHGSSNDVFHHGFDRHQVAEWLANAGFNHVSIKDAHLLTKPASTDPMRTYSVFLAVGQKGQG